MISKLLVAVVALLSIQTGFFLATWIRIAVNFIKLYDLLELLVSTRPTPKNGN